ncbi:MAG: leucine-rich repeat domain-containing protein [Mycoplasma sp.]|nr:leucine-rich repeat domain-containing protein [Candidatus Hennigella equi]
MKLLKNVVLTAATTIAVTPIISSCTFVRTVVTLTEIKAKLPETKMELVEDTKLVSDPISIECFDQNGNTMTADTNVVLKTQDELTPPDWIWVDKMNRINVKGDCEPSQYTFHLFVEDKQQTVKSEELEFNVNVLQAPLLPPDALQIDAPSETNVFYTQSVKITLTPIVCKEEYPQDVISHDCYWSITKVDREIPLDLNLNPLFTLINSDHDCVLEISKDIDETYIGTYNISIQAISKLNPEAFDEVHLQINIVNGFVQIDETTKYTYSRTSLDQHWSLTSVPKGTVVIKDVLEEIYGIPVSVIPDNFCSNNQISRLSSVILPMSICQIGDYAFANQTNFYALAMPGVRCVGKSAFEGCGNVALLNTYDQPQLEVAYEKAFYGCSAFNLSSVCNFSTIYDLAFAGSGIKEINLGGCISVIGKNCFSDCSRLETIIIPVTNPPKLRGPLYSGSAHPKAIKVPQNGIENYKNNPTWSIYNDIIVEI